MSKPVKEMIVRQYEAQFADTPGAVLINNQLLEANDNHALRTALKEKGIQVTLVKNSLAKKVFADTPLEGANELFSGPTAVVYPVDDEGSVVQAARELIEHAKAFEKLEFRGAVMEGIVFGPDEVKKLSEYPTKDEAKAKVVTVFLSPAKNLAGAVTSPASNIAGILKTLQTKLEAGETIAKAS